MDLLSNHRIQGFLPRHFSSTVICWIIPPSQIQFTQKIRWWHDMFLRNTNFFHIPIGRISEKPSGFLHNEIFCGGGFLLEIIVWGVLFAIAMRNYRGVMNCYIQNFDISAVASFLLEGFPWLFFLWTLMWSSRNPLARSRCCQWCQELQRSVPEVCFFFRRLAWGLLDVKTSRKGATKII